MVPSFDAKEVWLRLGRKQKVQEKGYLVYDHERNELNLVAQCFPTLLGKQEKKEKLKELEKQCVRYAIRLLEPEKASVWPIRPSRSKVRVGNQLVYASALSRDAAVSALCPHSANTAIARKKKGGRRGEHGTGASRAAADVEADRGEGHGARNSLGCEAVAPRALSADNAIAEDQKRCVFTGCRAVQKAGRA